MSQNNRFEDVNIVTLAMGGIVVSLIAIMALVLPSFIQNFSTYPFQDKFVYVTGFLMILLTTICVAGILIGRLNN